MKHLNIFFFLNKLKFFEDQRNLIDPFFPETLKQSLALIAGLRFKYSAARLRSSRSSRQIGPYVDQYGIFSDVSLVPFADWSGRTPQSDYLLSSREGAIFVGHRLSREYETAFVIDTYNRATTGLLLHEQMRNEFLLVL